MWRRLIARLLRRRYMVAHDLDGSSSLGLTPIRFRGDETRTFWILTGQED